MPQCIPTQHNNKEKKKKKLKTKQAYHVIHRPSDGYVPEGNEASITKTYIHSYVYWVWWVRRH
jgi:hypothetical protein